MSPRNPDAAVRQLVVSIHDVMPETLNQTEAIFQRLVAAGLDTTTLLVVPGRDWDKPALDRLRALFAAGAIPAGHGWTHECDRISRFYHRLHSALISRNVAEHLALDAADIIDLITRCHAWFAEHDLPAPELYVPPAWAMGSVSRQALARTPFGLFEVLSGVYDTRSGRFRRSAMVGFEADTRFRAFSCRAWNAFNLWRAGTSRPIRVAIHPHDPELLLGRDLERLIAMGGDSFDYRAAV